MNAFRNRVVNGSSLICVRSRDFSITNDHTFEPLAYTRDIDMLSTVARRAADSIPDRQHRLAIHRIRLGSTREDTIY